MPQLVVFLFKTHFLHTYEYNTDHFLKHYFYSASTNLISERNHEIQCEDSKSIDNITESDKKVETTTKISSQNKTEHRERTLFIMVCCITFTFFICHLPR